MKRESTYPFLDEACQVAGEKQDNLLLLYPNPGNGIAQLKFAEQPQA